MEGLQKIINSKSKTFLAFCFCFIVGTGAASLFDPPAGIDFYFYIFLFFLVTFTIITWHNYIVRFLVLCSLFLTLGVWRFTLTIPNCTNPTILCNYNGHKITMAGWVSEEPDRRVDGTKYMVSVTSIDDNVGARYILPQQTTSTVGANGRSPLQLVTGKMLISTRLYPEYHYGDTLTISCRIEKPKNSDGSTFRYDKYLARMGVWSVCGNPTIVILSDSQGSKRQTDLDSSVAALSENDSGLLVRHLMTRIFAFKSLVQAQLNKLWAEPDSSFMAGILFGSKSGLPQDLVDNFSKTGVTHIIAVSGFNVTIIVVALMFVLIGLGLRRQQAFWVVVCFIILFIFFTGATASVIRAGVMGLMVLVAKQLGRLTRITNVLILAAAVMLFINPYLLVWDAGFQLSFLATMGLVYISPVIQTVIPTSQEESLSQSPDGQRSLGVRPLEMTIKKVLSFVYEPLIQTLSAIIATLPLILYQFGRLSLVAPLVNVLVLWIIPWLMLGGFVSLALSFIFYRLGQLAAYITSVGLKYVLFVVEFFGRQSWSAVEWQVPLWVMVVAYSVLWLVIARSAATKQSREQ